MNAASCKVVVDDMNAKLLAIKSGTLKLKPEQVIREAGTALTIEIGKAYQNGGPGREPVVDFWELTCKEFLTWTPGECAEGAKFINTFAPA